MNRRERSVTHFEGLGDLWQKECKYLDQIFEKRIPFNSKELISFYDYVYYHCSSFVHNSNVRSQDPGKHLYENLTNYMNTRLQEIAAEIEIITDDEQLIIKYVEYWDPFWKACEELNRGCRYLNQNWVKREQFEKHDHIHHVYRMAMIRWKEEVFSPIDRALVTVITMILRQRPGKQAKSLVYQVLKSIVELYANDEKQAVPVPNKLNNVFTEEVVGFYKSETLAEFQRITLSGSYCDLKHFLKYACLAMPEIKEGVQFKAILKRHIALQLEKAISKSLGGRDYLNAFMALRHSPLERALRDQKELVAVIDQVCTDSINAMNQKRDPILILNEYCNELMTKKQESEKALIEELKRIVELVEFLNEKDKFIQQYWKVLRTRQINETSTWDGNESTMISLLTKKFGNEATCRLSNQLTELARSRIVKDGFEEYLTSRNIRFGFDFRLKCFESRGGDDNFKLILPAELQQAASEFYSFYCQHNIGRKIEFNFEISSGEMICHLKHSTHILQVNTLQMALLLLFNHQKRLTINEMVDMLGTSTQILQPVLDFWKTIGFLISSGLALEVNMNFTSRKRRLNLNKVSTKTRKIEDKEDYELKNRRKYQMDAAVVRIMKKYKILEHSQLVAHVIDELKNLFTPKIGFIKERIEVLLNKDTPDIERTQSSTYRYVS
ncbi:cullin homolog 1 [Drosophila elegans]|uniref:cullin homolog 1 n=1 Tax=Drosophila elegans TaxID=30023 RepID=UPI0007E8498D|nr:cullin homolog 1 [Drosophila elegans]